MIKTIASVGLPVDEKLEIKKNRILPEEVMSSIDSMKRISIVTGIHGDELEGQYVCFELQRRIGQNRECLAGIVDIYPAMNPLGIDSITRGIPAFDLDMNRLFPGDINGSMMEYVTARIMEDVAGSDCVLDIHASNIYLTEIPQIRINELHQDTLVPVAEAANVDFIWVHGASTVLEATFAHSLNTVGTPVLVVEMGVGMRITQSYGDQMVDGIFNLMKKMGIWTGEVNPVRKPMISRNPEDVSYLNASVGGVFIPAVQHGAKMKQGERIGRIVDPLYGEVLDEVCAPEDGMLFTIRNYPIVVEGSLMGRLLKKEVCGYE
ncbi:MAG: M14 family metallopeptidase [Muribaculaceae bacterium]|nr:M14 family metallopeptidase [Roseburia sp.]MCM1431389.1 M14 family metallopeptidase [Muribaculaceae bacterium]MCM1491831.1 M14 family metallopeptidase [Muribaculaceae bacterium]